MRGLLLTLALAALCALGGLVVLWQFCGVDPAPVPPVTVVMAAETPEVPVLQQGALPGVDRTSGELTPRDAVLEVALVVDSDAPGSLQAAADMEVDVSLGALARGEGGTRPPRFSGITDRRGLVRFPIPRGDGQSAFVTCGQGTATSAVLSADEVVRVTLRLTARAMVRGRVVDESGRGIGGADLVLVPWVDRASHPPRPRQIGRSRADGSFALALAAGGRLGAEHADFAPSAMYVVQTEVDRTKPAINEAFEFKLLATRAHAEGVVTDPRGDPVANALVEFRTLAPVPAGASLAAPPQRARSDVNGRIAMHQLLPGKMEYAARASGFGAARGAFMADPTRRALLEIKLPAACEVHGLVQTEDGSPIAGARVWSGAIDAFDGAWTVSSSDGSFRLRDVTPGMVELTAWESSGTRATPDTRRAQTRFEVQVGDTGHWIATLSVPSQRGVVRGDVVGTDGAPRAGWSVCARSNSSITTGVTDAQGKFVVASPGTGTLDLLAYAPTAKPNSFAKGSMLGVDPAASPVRIVVDDQQRGGSLTARVEAEGQRPLAATVTCWHRERREPARFQASADGLVRMDCIPAGTLDVHVEHAGQAPWSKLQVRVDSGKNVDLGTIVLDPGAMLHGKVTGPGGVVPEQLIVALRTGEQRLVGEYSAGTYRFAAVPSGDHVLQMQGTGVAAHSFEIRLEAGVDKQQDVELQAGVPRRFVIEVPPEAGRTVSLAIRPKDTLHTWYATIDAQPAAGTNFGIATFVAFMAPGTYEAVAWTSEQWLARTEVWFVEGDDSERRLRLDRH